jgi:hypothetical protein
LVALSLDTIFVLVPSTWNVPGAGPITTTPNKGFANGRLEALPIEADELVSAGAKLPGALFEAEGANKAGGRLGVRVGVYDTGGSEPIAFVEEAVGRVIPKAAVSPATVCGRRGVRVLQGSDGHGAEESAVCDYWARIRGASTSFILLRFWRTGPASADDEKLFDEVAGSVIFDDGGSFSGPARTVTLRRYAPPGPEAVEPEGFRYIGWRLGKVFHTKSIAVKEVPLMTGMGSLRDAALLVGLFLPWVVATLVLVGVGPVLLLGGLSAAGTMPQLRSHGSKAILALALVLGGLLVFGIATS